VLWRGTCKLTAIMKRTTEYRRTATGLLIAVVMMLFGLQQPLPAQEAAQDPGVESLDTIRSTAQAFVKSLIPE